MACTCRLLGEFKNSFTTDVLKTEVPHIIIYVFKILAHISSSGFLFQVSNFSQENQAVFLWTLLLDLLPSVGIIIVTVRIPSHQKGCIQLF